MLYSRIPTSTQVVVPCYYGLYVHNRCYSRRDLLRVTIKRIYLHMGCRECWSKACQILRLPRCLVGMYRMDDLYREQLPSMSFKVMVDSILIFIDHSQLYRFPTCCLGGQLPWRCWKWQYPVAGSDMGNIRRNVVVVSGDQLPSAKILFWCLQIFHRPYDARLLPVSHLVAHWCFKNLRFPVSHWCLHDDL